jgi:SAM-dependent methyltransferase
LGGADEVAEAFLSAGAACGWLRRRNGAYGLTRRSARLAANPSFQALVLYEAEVRERGLRLLPEVMRGVARPGLDPSSHPLIAQISSLALPHALKVLRRLPGLASPGARFLDVGCGTADYLIALSGRFPNAQCLGIDLDPNVVVLANERAQRAAVGGRIRVQSGDIRACALEPPYTLILANQILHYFAPGERATLVERLASLLAPGGHLALQQVVRLTDRPLKSIAFFDLFLRAHAGMGPLPTEDEVARLLKGAGLELARPRRIAGLRVLLCFIARKPEA